jgi:2-polyprenyl-3-methyl-5-hydroxy-6-metoxy-1,4-benzoquinol methylase
MKVWDDISARYQGSVQISTTDVHYGPCGPGERELRLLGDVRGKDILEIGCGGGQNSIALAKLGARVVGVDSSERQISFARDLAAREQAELSLVVADYRDLLKWNDDAFDILISCFCIEYIEDLSMFLSSARHVLRDGGVLVLCDLHPAVSGADIVGISMKSYGETVDYFKNRALRFKWRFTDGSSVELVRYHRTLSDLFASLRGGNFFIEDIREPQVSLDRCEDERFPYRDLTLRAEQNVWAKLPYTLIIKATVKKNRS